MENKGLNVFNTSCVLAKPSTGARQPSSFCLEFRPAIPGSLIVDNPNDSQKGS
jgi:hypothetical protein